MHKQRKRKRACAMLAGALALSLMLLLSCYLIQRYWAHRNGYFVPDYPRVELTEESDYETIFLQTGLGRPAVDKLLAEGNFQVILDAQDAFFNPPKGKCAPFLGWFTRQDKLEEPGPALVDLQPGDIVLTLSTHSFGWRHGHAGLAIDEDTTLECIILGTDSMLCDASHWNTYTNYAVLRIKDITPKLQQEAAEYGKFALLGIPYHLTSGFIGPKAPAPDDWQFGLHCSYLVWYAWNHFGYDIDSDGGRLASSYDLLHSDLLEVIQLYGMNPHDFPDSGSGA